MKKLLLIAISLVISGCATTANYEKILNTWLGAHADNLVSSWGPPRGSYELSDGSHVLEYINQRNAQIGGFTYTTPQTTFHSGSTSIYGYGGSAYGTYSGTSTTYVEQQTPVYNLNLSCKTRFTINPNGIIQNWSWRGNDCKAYAPKGISEKPATPKIFSPTPTDESHERTSGLGEVFVKYPDLNLLSHPSFSGDKIVSIDTNESLKAISETDNWVKVKTQAGKTGWVAKSWLQEK